MSFCRIGLGEGRRAPYYPQVVAERGDVLVIILDLVQSCQAGLNLFYTSPLFSLAALFVQKGSAEVLI
jgi:hypothetical protein